jgi:HEAT repeat protein
LANKEFLEFCKRFYLTLNHPFAEEKKQEIKGEKLEFALELLEYILENKIDEERLQDLDVRFNSAFSNYLNMPRNEVGAFCNSIERLAGLLDPFLKKLVFLLYPDRKLQSGNKAIPLWHTSDFSNILAELNIATVNLKRSDKEFWKEQDSEQAILRIAFVTRHKGVHESHSYDLQSLEKTAYSVIGTYIITCLRVSGDEVVRQKFLGNIEQRRFERLLKGKAEAYDTTGSLLSEIEHLNIYRYRRNIKCGFEEIRFLFINYLAEKGPVYYWLRNQDKNLIKQLAESCLNVHDETIRRNAIRYLVRENRLFELKDILEDFKDYELKVELGEHIKQFSKRGDMDILLPLYKSKAEEVSDAAAEALCKIIDNDKDPTLHRLVFSGSIQLRFLFEMLICHAAKKTRVNYYRKFENLNDKESQALAIYSLGETGDEKDIRLIKEWLRKRRRNGKIRYACWYAIARIASRMKDRILVLKLLKSRKGIVQISAINAVTREGLGSYFYKIFSIRGTLKGLLCGALLRISTRKDIPVLKRYLRKLDLDNFTRKVVLAISKWGEQKEFNYLLDLFLSCPKKIEFWNHVKIATDVGMLCGRKSLSKLKMIINSSEFWEYFGSNRPSDAIPAKNFENLPLIKRVVAYAFCKIASDKEKAILKKMLWHNYNWISYLASDALARVSNEDDLDELINEVLSHSKSQDSTNAVIAISLIDEKLNSW